MDRLFDTVEDYVAYVRDAMQDFAETQLQEHLVGTMAFFALAHVYKVYEPQMYERRFTLTDSDYYKSNIKTSGYRTSNSQLDIYTYSTSPHVKSVVEGLPYDFHFEYYNKKRPYVKYADDLLRSSLGINELKSQMISFYKDYGLDAR